MNENIDKNGFTEFVENEFIIVFLEENKDE